MLSGYLGTSMSKLLSRRSRDFSREFQTSIRHHPISLHVDSCSPIGLGMCRRPLILCYYLGGLLFLWGRGIILGWFSEPWVLWSGRFTVFLFWKRGDSMGQTKGEGLSRRGFLRGAGGMIALPTIVSATSLGAEGRPAAAVPETIHRDGPALILDSGLPAGKQLACQPLAGHKVLKRESFLSAIRGLGYRNASNWLQATVDRLYSSTHGVATIRRGPSFFVRDPRAK